MSATLVLSGVRFGYDAAAPILNGVDLEIGTGVTLVLGPNGAGKSTLLKLAAGVEKPDAGSVHLNGHDLWKAEAAARRDLAYVPEQPDITPYASVGAVLRFVSRLRGAPWSEAEALLDELEMTEASGRSVRELSKGQRHRVLLAAARLGSPRTLLLDEPLSALDRGLRQSTLDWVERTRDAGGSVLVVTHELKPFEDMATRAVSVRRGDVRVVESLPEDPAVRSMKLEALARGDWE